MRTSCCLYLIVDRLPRRWHCLKTVIQISLSIDVRTCVLMSFLFIIFFFYCSHLMENQISNVERGAFDELKELERL